MKKFLIFISVILVLLTQTSCQYGFYSSLFGESDADERFDKMTLLWGANVPDVGGSGTYSGVVITDFHIGSSTSAPDEKFLLWLKNQFQNENESLRPKFVVCLGDSTDTASVNEFERYRTFIVQIRDLARQYLGDDNFKVYTTLGNHDLYHNGWELWYKTVYPFTSSYYFTLGGTESTLGFSFYFLDSANGTLGKNQLESFQDLLEKDIRPKIIFTHYPVYAPEAFLFSMQNSVERNLILKSAAENNVKQIFEGHAHKDLNHSYSKFKESIIPSLRYNSSFCFFTVDEKTQSVASRIVELK